MANDDALGAIERLERALRRIENATERLASNAAATELRTRHLALQAEVEAAVTNLDRLIAAAEPS